jgi:hypothetical protein
MQNVISYSKTSNTGARYKKVERREKSGKILDYPWKELHLSKAER